MLARARREDDALGRLTDRQRVLAVLRYLSG
jgi:hypothetical protein